MFFANGPECTVTLNSKLANFKIWLFEPLVLRKKKKERKKERKEKKRDRKKKPDGFLLFFFFKDLVMWLSVKNATLGMEICINCKSIKQKRNVVCGRWSQLYASHMCKTVFRFNLNSFTQSLTKYQTFSKLPHISHINKNRNCKVTDQLLLLYKFLWQGHVRNLLLFIFASCEPF